MRILGKQFLSSFFIISLVLVLFTIFVINEFKKYEVSLTKKELLSAADLLSAFLENPVSQGNREEVNRLVSDLGSANGSFINGQRLLAKEIRVLRHGDELRLGKLVMTVSFRHPANQ